MGSRSTFLGGVETQGKCTFLRAT